jgi:hypothetical protein
LLRSPTPLRRKVLEFVRNTQGGQCLVCAFPLTLATHLHHVIASDDGGPSHPLNLVGLCPNHHAILEQIRRHVAPRQSYDASEWEERAQAAISATTDLTPEARDVLMTIAEPHPLRQPIQDLLKGNLHRKYHAALTREIVPADVHLLTVSNSARPKTILVWRVSQTASYTPISADSFISELTEVATSIGAHDFTEVIALHLQKLGLSAYAA